MLVIDDTQSRASSESPLTPSHISTPTVSSAEAACPLSESTGAPLPSSPSPATIDSAPLADSAGALLPDNPSPAPSPPSGESEEEKAKKLLYCSLCKVAVNSLSQLEAHNKGNLYMCAAPQAHAPKMRNMHNWNRWIMAAVNLKLIGQK